MSSRRCCRSVQIFIVLCARLINAATESEGTSAVSTSRTKWEAFRSATPAPGGTEVVTRVGTVDDAATLDFTSAGTSDESVTMETSTVSTPDEPVTMETSSVSTPDEPVTMETSTVSTPDEPVTVDSRAVTVLNVSETTPATTDKPVLTTDGCLCDLTPDFCDIGCCCDTFDCGVSNLSTVFTGCPQNAVLGVCIENWLMFRANVNSTLVTVTDSLFCVRSEEDIAPRALKAVSQYPALVDSYHFSPPILKNSSYGRAFYKVDDVIQTYFSSSSVRGLLLQPYPGVGTAFCVNYNPAKFLRSGSFSCTRMLTPQSCTTDPNLSARSYFFNLNLIKIPIVETVPVSKLLIPVTPLSDWPAPSRQNNSCVNVVTKVEFVIKYTRRGELATATVNVVLADVDLNQLLLQTHAVQFQLAAPSPTPGGPVPAVGLTVGAPVIGRFNEELTTLTMLRASQGGQCSSDPSRRTPILFTHNTITGCAFSSPSNDCSEVRSQIYGILQGLATPDEIAMNSGSQLNWTRVITQECPINLQETCESGCILPSSLSIQVLWARQGLLNLPQNYILGAKYIFQCQNIKCPVSSPVILTTEVTFADTTVYPEPSRGQPRPNWKFPFGFFTRGTVELDGHIINSSEKITWSSMLFTVILINGLDFFLMDSSY